MHVSRLSLTDFRSYEQADLALLPGITAFVGANGQGKTNLVEAVGFLAGLESHRVAQNAPLVRQGCSRALVRGEVVSADRTTLIELEINPGASVRARLNRVAVPRVREVVGRLRTVLFAPEDLALVKGDPAERRMFLDGLITTASPRMSAVRADYDKVLRQRNALLKSARNSRRPDPHLHSTLDVWDEQLAHLGADIVAARLGLVAHLGPAATRAYAEVAPAGSARVVGMAYMSSLKELLPEEHSRQALRSALLEALTTRRKEEIDRGITLAGPHRDELLLTLGEPGAAPMPAKGFASHGESWTLALSLRIAAFWLLKDDSLGEPVLILDDVFAELDSTRRERLATLVSGAEQVLITAAVEEDVPRILSGQRFQVFAGTVAHV